MLAMTVEQMKTSKKEFINGCRMLVALPNECGGSGFFLPPF